MKKAWLTVRSLILWILSGLHFFIVCTFLVLLAIFIDPRKNDWPQRVFFRNILRVAGVKFEVRRSPGFDPNRTAIFICNHVNIFDPFVNLFRDSAVRSRLRAGIAFQGACVWLDDEALRQRAGAGRADARRP